MTKTIARHISQLDVLLGSQPDYVSSDYRAEFLEGRETLTARTRRSRLPWLVLALGLALGTAFYFSSKPLDLSKLDLTQLSVSTNGLATDGLSPLTDLSLQAKILLGLTALTTVIGLLSLIGQFRKRPVTATASHVVEGEIVKGKFRSKSSTHHFKVRFLNPEGKKRKTSFSTSAYRLGDVGEGSRVAVLYSDKYDRGVVL